MDNFKTWLEAIGFDDSYSIWLKVLDERRQEWPKVVAPYGNEISEREVTATSFTQAKKFKTPENALKWLEKNAPKWEFNFSVYAIARNGDIAANPTYDYMFPFQWRTL
jgi:hypothetical protein